MLVNRFFLVTVTATLLVFSCKPDPVTYDCTGLTPTYAADVKSIIDNNCATSGCHSASSHANGKDYSTYALVKSGSEKNSFMGSMQHLSGYESMPKGASQLSDSLLQTISCWIENGAPE
jgi:hypothetical protein